MKEKSLLPRMLRATLPLLATLAIAAPASAADMPPFLAAPTGMTVDVAVPLNGGYFPANAVVKLSITEPLGQQVDNYLLVGADGALSYALSASQAGNYQIRVSDQAGNVLASASIFVAGH